MTRHPRLTLNFEMGISIHNSGSYGSGQDKGQPSPAPLIRLS
jgi:hypothetical protein